METVEAILLLMAACVGFALLARRLHLPYAVILVLGGMALAFVPGVPQVTLDPALALAFFLPPLLQASAYRTDWRAFRSNLRPILLLAIGAVLWTALCIAVVAKWLIPELPWAAAVALGAIVAPPDAVAASAVLQRLRLPRRIVTVLEGESLVNDATALVLYRFALAALAAGGVAIEAAAGQFVLVALGGIAVGWAVGRAAAWAIARLSDTLLETAVSFLACFGAFFAAEAAHLSGVIAVVVTGIVLGQRQHAIFSARSRIEARAVWDFIEFVLTSLIFILVGLQLNAILERLAGRSVLELILLAAALSLALIASRFVWVYPATWLPRALWPPLRRRDPMPPLGHVFVISWAGMRGVVSLAAALALPLDFPERDLIVFLAFCAILATLIVQGTTLESVIRWLAIEEPRRSGMPESEAEARHVTARAMHQHLAAQREDPMYGVIAADLLPEYQDRTRIFAQASGATASELTARLQLRLAALRAGRAALIEHHRGSLLSEEALVAVEQEIDLEELRVLKLLGAGGTT
jgi:CPA1 family monovalent cation:H+ antiporter